MALGLLGAKEYLPQMLSLLKSKNQYDHQGAITALTYFGAKEYSKDVAAILTNKEFQFDDDSSPIFFLVEMGTAHNYKKELISMPAAPGRGTMRAFSGM
jgi:HEAT repeat protein